MTVIGNPMLSYSLGFVMGIAVPVLLFELFVCSNPVASFWLGREVDAPRHDAQQADVQPAPQDVPVSEKASVP